MKIKTFSSSNLSTIQSEVNKFSEDNEVVNVQYNSQPNMIIGLQQNCAEVRVQHYAVVSYIEKGIKGKVEG